MKISLVTLRNPFTEVDRGGIESHVANLAVALRKLGHDVFVVTSTYRGQGYVEPDDIQVISVGLRFKNLFLRSLYFSLKAANILRTLNREGVDIFNGQAGFSIPLCMFTSQSAAKVLTVHTGNGLDLAILEDLRRRHQWTHIWKYALKYSVLKSWRRWYMKAADGYVFVSPWAQNDMFHFYPFLRTRSFHVIRNGSLPLVNPSSSKQYDLAYIGRLSSPKGIDILIRAMSLLAKQNLRPKTVIVGNGELRENLVSLTRDHRLLRNIRFRNELNYSETQKLIAHSRYVVLSSFYESDPLVIRESKALRVPIIVSDIPQLREHIENGKTGFLFKAGDRTHLAEVIKNALEMQSSEYQKMCSHVSSKAVRTWKEVAEDFLSFYRHVLRRKESHEV